MKVIFILCNMITYTNNILMNFRLFCLVNFGLKFHLFRFLKSQTNQFYIKLWFSN